MGKLLKKPTWTFDLLVCYAMPVLIGATAWFHTDEVNLRNVIVTVVGCTLSILIRLKAMKENWADD
jgi:uncharacterized membrane protein YeiH